MNKKAKELGLTNTHFANPSGLDAEGHFTTAYDLAMLEESKVSAPKKHKADRISFFTVSVPSFIKVCTAYEQERDLLS